MGSKRFKNSQCVYCTEATSDTGDHVFAREFFLLEHRDNLPKVPACARCNNKKSAIEHYLTAVLPFAGRHAHATANLITQVPKRLNENTRLHKELSDGKQLVKILSEKNEASNLSLPLREDAIGSLFCYIIKGLIWHHWHLILPADYSIKIFFPTAYGERIFKEKIFGLKGGCRVQQELGNRTVIYEGIQSIDTPYSTAWRFHFYGGMVLSDGEGLASMEIVGITIHKRALTNET